MKVWKHVLFFSEIVRAGKVQGIAGQVHERKARLVACQGVALASIQVALSEEELKEQLEKDSDSIDDRYLIKCRRVKSIFELIAKRDAGWGMRTLTLL